MLRPGILIHMHTHKITYVHAYLAHKPAHMFAPSIPIHIHNITYIHVQTNLHMFPANNTPAQKWKLVPVKVDLPKAATAPAPSKLFPAKTTGMSLCVCVCVCVCGGDSHTHTTWITQAIASYVFHRLVERYRRLQGQAEHDPRGCIHQRLSLFHLAGIARLFLAHRIHSQP